MQVCLCGRSHLVILLEYDILLPPYNCSVHGRQWLKSLHVSRSEEKSWVLSSFEQANTQLIQILFIDGYVFARLEPKKVHRWRMRPYVAYMPLFLMQLGTLTTWRRRAILWDYLGKAEGNIVAFLSDPACQAVLDDIQTRFCKATQTPGVYKSGSIRLTANSGRAVVMRRPNTQLNKANK